VTISARTSSGSGISVAWSSVLARRDVVGASSAIVSLSCILTPLRRRRARGLGQWARVLLQNAPNFGSVLALPLGVEAGGLEHRAEWRRIRTIEHDTRLGQLRLGILVEARDVFTLLERGRIEILGERILHFLWQRLELLRVTEDEMPVPRMRGQRAILLHFIQLGALDQCQRVLLSVDDLGLKRRVQFAERYGGR